MCNSTQNSGNYINYLDGTNSSNSKIVTNTSNKTSEFVSLKQPTIINTNQKVENNYILLK